jgi:hypothetical protein
MIIRKHATRQHNLPYIVKTSSWRAISKVLKVLNIRRTVYIGYFYLLFYSGVKLGLSFKKREFKLRVSEKKQETGENYIISSSMICAVHEILLGPRERK